jgi:hypothetical protein
MRRAGGVTQVVVSLPNKLEALRTNPSTTIQKKKKKKKIEKPFWSKYCLGELGNWCAFC